jgi:hypothetical protein
MVSKSLNTTRGKEAEVTRGIALDFMAILPPHSDVFGLIPRLRIWGLGVRIFSGAPFSSGQTSFLKATEPRFRT